MVGLTGGIGSGKSAVAARLAELGAVVIDADRLAREVVAPGTDGLAEIVAAFGRPGARPRRRAGPGGAGRGRLRRRRRPAAGWRRSSIRGSGRVPPSWSPRRRRTRSWSTTCRCWSRWGSRRRTTWWSWCRRRWRPGWSGWPRDRGMDRGGGRAADRRAGRRRPPAGGGRRGARATTATWRSCTPRWTGCGATGCCPTRRTCGRGGRSGRSRWCSTEPDPTWPEQYARLAARIRHALAPADLRIDHIGSTAVPGLAAKDVIDIQLGRAVASPTRTGRWPSGSPTPGSPGCRAQWWDNPRPAGSGRWEKRLHGSADPAARCTCTCGWPDRRAGGTPC